MSMWEFGENTPHDNNLYQKTNGVLTKPRSLEPFGENSSEHTRMPAELLILGRFGVRYAYLTASLKLSQKYRLHPAEILIQGKVITHDIWERAQALLRDEIASRRQKKRQRSHLLWNAVNFLKHKKPEYSAAKVFQWKQIIFLALSIAFLTFSIASPNENWLFILLLLLTLFYTFGVCFRGIMLASYEDNPSNADALTLTNDDELPTYCVLVALYKESNQIASLTNSLSELDWPKHLLDIKLICEADDLETIHAIKSACLPSYFQLVIVPPQHPRTKPKALNFALPLCHGTYLVLYDAEDLPSPGQLKEAHFKFVSSEERLACLQAPLLIHNANENWLTRMFAIEYQTLFTGILPVLSRWKAPLPLGGTSNHFKLSVLKEIGGWDPYNVTEDADLGIRLFRKDYLCSTLKLPTYEESPPHFGPWLRQRTRWLKGWMQTILVHNRKPIKFAQQLGLKNLLIFHLFLTAIVISALIHPIFIYLSVLQILNISREIASGFDFAIVMTSVFNLVGGYTTYGLMAFAVLRSTSNFKLSKWLLSLPFYWLLISVAAWRALFQLILKPHMWEKTPHGLTRSRNGDNNFIEFDI